MLVQLSILSTLPLLDFLAPSLAGSIPSCRTVPSLCSMVPALCALPQGLFLDPLLYVICTADVSALLG